MCHCVYFHFSVIYLFDALTGKPLGDGKPLAHKVNNPLFCIAIENYMYVCVDRTVILDALYLGKR